MGYHFALLFCKICTDPFKIQNKNTFLFSSFTLNIIIKVLKRKNILRTSGLQRCGFLLTALAVRSAVRVRTQEKINTQQGRLAGRGANVFSETSVRKEKKNEKMALKKQ